MAERDALSIYYMSTSEKDKLMKTYSEMVSLVMANTISTKLKNTDIEGDIAPGATVKVRRFKTSSSQPYGTARTTGAGNKLINRGVDVTIDTDREIVEELETFDIERYGIPDIIAKRVENHRLTMQAELDQAYFDTLEDAATEVAVSGSSVEEKVLSLVRELELLENEHVNKVDRSMMVLTLNPKWYDALTQHIYTLPNPAGQSTQTFHGVEIYSAPRQSVDAIIQVRKSVAQPTVVYPYKVKDIGISMAVAVCLFYYYGTKAVAPDCILKASLGDVISV